jgi:hypothetical protein
LVVGVILAEHHDKPEALAAHVHTAKPLQRLQLSQTACESFIKESAEEIAAVREALG